MLSRLLARGYGVQSFFFKNLLEVFFQLLADSQTIQLSQDQDSAFSLLALLQENLSLLLSRFRYDTVTSMHSLLVD
jgi:hypothetical protein